MVIFHSYVHVYKRVWWGAIFLGSHPHHPLTWIYLNLADPPALPGQLARDLEQCRCFVNGWVNVSEKTTQSK
jgi:hypothetical protein